MNPCKPCLYYPICMERRGRCTEYKDLEGVKREIEMLNKKEKPATRSKADQRPQGPQL